MAECVPVYEGERMPDGAFSFDIDSCWDIDVDISQLDFVINEPHLITTWWAAGFLKVEILAGDYYSPEGLKVRLWTKGMMPHSFKFLARVFHDKQKNQVIVKTDGDFNGIGTISLNAVTKNKSQIHINWRTSVNNHYLYPLMILLKPIFIANHRWAMRRGEQGIKQELIYRNAPQQDNMRQRQKPTFPHSLFISKIRNS